MPKSINSNPASTNVLYNLLVQLNKYLTSVHYVLGSELGNGVALMCLQVC